MNIIINIMIVNKEQEYILMQNDMPKLSFFAHSSPLPTMGHCEEVRRSNLSIWNRNLLLNEIASLHCISFAMIPVL